MADSSEELFRSENVDANVCSIVNVGKAGGKVQAVYAAFSKIYYYVLEDIKYNNNKSGQEESLNVLVMRVGVSEKDGKLILHKGFNRRTSENFYKSARHLNDMNDFFKEITKHKPHSITIWDRPAAKKESGYIVMNYCCGIDNPEELEQLSRLRNENGEKLDYLNIESSASPVRIGMKSVRETKQSMLFGSDIDNFRKFIEDYVNYETKVKNEVKKASSLSVFVKTANSILKANKDNPAPVEDADDDDIDDDDDDDDDDDESDTEPQAKKHSDDVEVIEEVIERDEPAVEVKTVSPAMEIENSAGTLPDSQEYKNQAPSQELNHPPENIESDDDDDEEVLLLKLKLAQSRKRKLARKK